MSMSIKQKVGLLQLPLYAVGAIVAFLAWQTGQSLKANSESQSLNRMALKSSKYVAEMGGALKGYMLDPSNEEEAKRKKEADDENAKVIALMKKSTTDESMLELIGELGEFDEKQLNPAEDHVLDLVGKGKIGDAQAYFKSTYLPLRVKYDALSSKLADMTEAQSLKANEEFETGVHDAIFKIVTYLAGGIVFTSALVLLTLFRVTRSLVTVKSHLSSVTTAFQKASQSVKDVSNNLAQSSTESAAAIQESVASMAEMSSMLKQTARNAESTSTLSTEVLLQSQSGEKVMGELSTSMSEISESSNRLKEIARVIENISAKTNVINDVVFKTQLLAVNASIEAARAGHHGKGFAVVANEVASLATLSGKASTEIRDLLYSSSSRVSEIIDGTSKAIGNGEAVCGRSIDAFGAIAKSIQVIADKIEQITVASREQEAGVAQASTALGQMNNAASIANSMAQKNSKLGQEIADQASVLNKIDRAMSLVVLGKHGGENQARRLSVVDRILTSDTQPDADARPSGNQTSDSGAHFGPSSSLVGDERKAVVSKFRQMLSSSDGGTRHETQGRSDGGANDKSNANRKSA